MRICAETNSLLRFCRICTGTGAHPLPHLLRDWGSPLAASAPELGLTPCRICAGTGLAPCHICAGTGLAPCHIYAGTGLTLATSTLGLGSACDCSQRVLAMACRCATTSTSRSRRTCPSQSRAYGLRALSLSRALLSHSISHFLLRPSPGADVGGVSPVSPDAARRRSPPRISCTTWALSR
jgi:hypothetical protein